MTPVARIICLGFAAAISVTEAASAGTATSTLGVQVVVQPSCTVSGATLDFGSYTSGQPGDLNGFTQIAYSPAGQLRFQLDGGINGTTSVRKLGNGGGGLLDYRIFRDSARTQNFGQGGEARLITLAAPGSGNVSVYGYTDTVVITLDF
jgi:spore coat protein U-like protein